MNLFISENFIDTVGTKVGVLALTRHVAEDDELIHLEAMDALCRVTAYESIDELTNAIKNGEFTDIALRDDELYVGGDTLRDLFEDLYPDDYTSVIAALTSSIQNATDTTLRLDHNCVPVVPEREEQMAFPVIAALEETRPIPADMNVAVAPAISDAVRLSPGRVQHIADPVPEGHVITAINGNQVVVKKLETPVDLSAPEPAFVKVEAVPFQGTQEGTEVRVPEVAEVALQDTLGELRFNGRAIRTTIPTGYNDVLFNIEDLYLHIYGLSTNPDYLQQVIVQNRLALERSAVYVRNGAVFANLQALAVFHQAISPCVEWYPMVARVTQAYTVNPHFNANFDLLGNLVG